MMHLLTRIFLRLFVPVSGYIILLQSLSLLLLIFHKYQEAAIALVLSLIFVIGVCLFPIGQWLCIFLENRFPQPQTLPNDITGIILCGSGFDQQMSLARGMPCYNVSIGRLIEFIKIANENPNVRLVFTGGGASSNKKVNEAKLAKEFFLACGLDVSRIEFETQARDTLENATLSYKLFNPLPHEKWILMTSAFHLPRAIGLFRQAGWNHIIPYPVDYNTSGLPILFNFDFVWALTQWRRASHELIEMFTNYLFGYSDALIPKPRLEIA